MTEKQQLPTCGIFYCRVSAKMKGCGSLQTSSWLDSDVLRNRQQKHTAIRYQQGEEKDNNTENDSNNGLRMNNEMTMTEKRFSFFADPQKEKRYAYTQLAHCLLSDTQANASLKSKSQILPPTFFL